MDFHYIPSHPPVRSCPTVAVLLFRPLIPGILLAPRDLSYVHVPCADTAVHSSREPRSVPRDLLSVSYSDLYGLPFSTNSLAAGVRRSPCRGLPSVWPDRWARSCKSVLHRDLSPCRSWALLRLNPRARHSAPFCFLGSPVLASTIHQQRRSPQQSTSPPLGAGPLAFPCPKTLGTTNPI